jgi:LCP family protein required for cell wall assembly
MKFKDLFHQKWTPFLIADAVIALLLLIAFAVLWYGLLQLGFFNIQLLALIGIIFLLVAAIFLLLGLWPKKAWLAWCWRVVTVLILCASIFASYTLYNSYYLLQNITSQRETYVQVELFSLAGSKYETVADLEGATIGMANAGDQTVISDVLSQLEEQVEDISYETYDDYYTLYEMLDEKEVDAILIPTNSLNILDEELENLEDKLQEIGTFEASRTTITTIASDVDISTEPFVVYIAGIDSGDDPSFDTRSDVNILLMVDPVNRHITTVSVPRDAYVPNPAYYNGSDKLTHLGNEGVENSVYGLEETFGIPIDFYAKVNFDSLIAIVDALGGIDVDVKISFTEQDENRSFKKKDLITLEAGQQTLNGKEALAYSRHRKTAGYGTTGRENAQQQVIKAIISKLTSAEGIARINDVLAVASEYVYTNMPYSAIQNFIAKQLEDVQPWSVSSQTLNSGLDATLTTCSMPGVPLSCYLLSEADIKQVYNRYMAMYDDAEMADFSFDLSDDPDCTIKYAKKQKVSDYLITASDYYDLSSYRVYYGLTGSPDYEAAEEIEKLERVSSSRDASKASSN